MLAGLGLTQEHIGAVIGVSDDVLRRDYPEELATGKALAIAEAAQSLRSKVRAGELAAIIFFLKTQAKWSEKVQLEHSGPDGGPIKHYLAMPEPVRKAQLQALADRVLQPSEATAADGFEEG